MNPTLARVLPGLVASVSCVSPLWAGGVRIVCVVGDRNFPDIASAVAAAQEGDVLLVGEGTYGPFTIDGKSLSIWAAPGATVRVDDGSGTPWVSSIMNLGAKQSVILSGLIFTGAWKWPALVLQDNEGFVRIQDCSICGWGGTLAGDCHGLSGGLGASVMYNAAASFLRCHLLGGAGESISLSCWCPDGLDDAHAGSGGSGLLVASSRICLYDTQVVGGSGGSVEHKTGCGDYPGNGATAMQVATGEIFASGSTFQGGNRGIACPGIWYCYKEGSGGHGVYVDGSSVLDALDCDLIGGGGTPPGAPWSGPGWVTPLAGTARKFSAPTIRPELTLIDVQLAGLTGDAVWLPRSTRLDHWLYIPVLSVWLIARPLRMPRAPAAVLPVGGTTAIVPPLWVPAAATHEQWVLQGMFVSPGEARLGSARHVLGLSLTVGPDCDANATSDYVDVLFGGAPDLDHNLIPDGCPGG